MSKEQKNKMVPKLRFTEFKFVKEWNVTTLGEVTYPVSEKNREGKKYPIYSINNVEGFLPQKDQFEGVNSHDRGYDISLYKLIQKNTFAYNPARINIGSLGYSGKLNDIIISSLYVCFKTTKDIDDIFLLYFLKSESFNRSVKKGVEGGIRSYLFYENFAKIEIQLPLIPEQQKIASCLSSLDDLFTTNSQMLEALKVHKKGVMQQLFPSEGERVPKLRFTEFKDSGEWENATLGDVVEKVGSGTTPFGGEVNYIESGRPFVRSQNVGWGFFLVDDIVFVDESLHQDSISTELKFDDVLLNITGASIGRSAVVNHLVVGGNVNQHVCIIRTIKSKLNPVYLNQYLISVYGQKQIDSFQAGGNRQGLNFEQIRSFFIPIPPTLKEQLKIADCLSSLDELITTQVEKIEQLKNHKKGLMQGLFPAINESN